MKKMLAESALIALAVLAIAARAQPAVSYAAQGQAAAPTIDPKSAPKPAAETEPVIDRKAARSQFAWTGRKREPSGWIPLQEAPIAAKAIRAELAAIQVSIDVDRKLDEALAKLDELHLRASLTAQVNTDVRPLVEIALARANLLRRLDRKPEALEATRELYLSAEETKKLADHEFVDVTRSQAQELARAYADERLVALRTALGSNSTADEDAGIASVVSSALATGYHQSITDLGLRAVPELERLVPATLGSMPHWSKDPLYLLTKASPMRAAEVALANFDAGGVSWKRRVLQAAGYVQTLSNDRAFIFTPGSSESPRFTYPPWLELAARLIDDRDSAPEIIPMLDKVFSNDAVSPELARALLRRLREPEPEIIPLAIQLLIQGRGRESVRPIFEGLLDNRSLELRYLAAGFLVEYEDSPGLRAALHHEDPKVRESVARSLQTRGVFTVNFVNSMQNATSSVSFTPTYDEPARAVLATLAGDESRDVRWEAVVVICKLRPPLDDAVYVALAHDRDEAIRVKLADSLDTTLRWWAKVLPVLAEDRSTTVLDHVDQCFNQVADKVIRDTSAPEDSAEEAFFAAFEKRRANRAAPFDRATLQAKHNGVFDRVVGSPRGLRILARLALEDADDAMLMSIVSTLSIGNDSNGQPKYSPRLSGLDGLTLVRLTRRVFEKMPESSDTFFAALTVIRESLGEPFLALAEDASAPRALRLRVIKLMADAPGPRISNALFAILTHANDGGPAADRIDNQLVLEIGGRLPIEENGAVLRRCLAEPSIPNDLARSLTAGLVYRRVPSDDLSVAILERWFEDYGTNGELIAYTLRNLSNLPRAKHGPWLVRALHTPAFAYEMAEIISGLCEPTYQAALADCLRAEWLPVGSLDRLSVQQCAISGLTAYLDDKSAEYLLQGIGYSTNKALREMCLEALTTIRKFQEERARWLERKTSQQARDDAVRELVKMLDDERAIVRANAATSLATLQAIDQLPRLVRLLQDKDTSVREAAQRALDRINDPALARSGAESGRVPVKDGGTKGAAQKDVAEDTPKHE